MTQQHHESPDLAATGPAQDAQDVQVAEDARALHDAHAVQGTQPPQPEQPVPAASPLAPGEKPSIGRVLRDQRKTLWIAVTLLVADFWILGQLDRWRLGTAIGIGVVLGLANHLATEFWLLRQITSAQPQTRNQMIGATLVRLAVLTVVAVGIAVLLWPEGAGLLLGLAVFRLIALLMTSVTLLKELKQP